MGWWGKTGILRQGIGEKIGRLADLFMPPLCLACSKGVDAHGTLCVSCWSELRFIEAPYCEVTGLPLPYDAGKGVVSPAALANPPPYARARAVLCYDDAAAFLISRFKYGDRIEAATAYARWLKRAGAKPLEEAELIVPVPLHRWRLLARRYNQSAELARALASLTGLTYAPDVLIRKRATRPQVGLSGRARRRNVTGAFGLAPDGMSLISGRHVVLIDDVVTTGATVNACARALVAGGAREVTVLCLARVVPAGSVSI